MREIILKIELDQVRKLRYALDHVQLTGDEHIDAVLSIFNDVLKECVTPTSTHENTRIPTIEKTISKLQGRLS